MKYLIAGLGNIGSEYKDTRHNIGFNILDAFAEASNVVFTDKRYGSVCETVLKGRKLILLKPSTSRICFGRVSISLPSCIPPHR